MMNINLYLADTVMVFSKSPAVVCLTVTAEWLCFLLYAERSLPALKKQLPGKIILLLASLFLQTLFYPVSLHCVLSIILWTLYLCYSGKSSWHTAVFESSIFCLFLELGKSIFRNGTLAMLICQHFPGVSPMQVSAITFLIYMLYIAVLGCVFLRIPRRISKMDFHTPQVAGLLFPLLLYLFIRQFQSGLGPDTEPEMYLYLDLIGFAVAACTMIVFQVTINMLVAQRSRSELEKARLLEHQQQKLYQIQKDSIEEVNRKYHDLKHYLTALESAADNEQLRVFAREMRGDIEPYETIQETGNDTMNILLAQKMLECQKKKIRLIPFINGTDLDRLSPVDLCTLFGNALDNAIEASGKIPDENLREISVHSERRGDLLIITFANYCAEPVTVTDGHTISTTKSDAASHGYGLASIRAIAEKYGGTIRISAAGHMFELVVMIP